MKNLVATCFTETGAKILAKTLTTKYGYTIIENPKYNESRGMWTFTYIDPTLETKDGDKRSKNKRTVKSTGQSKNKRASRSSME